MKNLIRWTRMQKGALIARNTKRKKAGKDKNRFLSSTLSTQHELIKHECKVFPPSLIIIALLVHLRIQLNLILEKSYANNFLQSTHTWLWYNFAQYTYPTPFDRLEFLSMISRTSLTWKLKRKKRKIFVRSNRNRRTWTEVAYTNIFYMYTTWWTASWGCSQDDHITHIFSFSLTPHIQNVETIQVIILLETEGRGSCTATGSKCISITCNQNVWRSVSWNKIAIILGHVWRNNWKFGTITHADVTKCENKGTKCRRIHYNID